VTTCTPRGRIELMSCSTAALLTPGSVTTLIVFTWPVSPSTCCAVGSVNAARVAPAMLFAVPNWAMPVIVNVRGCPAKRIFTRWPTENPNWCAVPASITTSELVVGGRPCTTFKLEICAFGSKLSPIVGAPPVEIALPSPATNWA
jgi:hypothetical protein